MVSTPPTQKRTKKARRFETLTPDHLLQIVGGTALTAGSNTVLDIVAARVVERSRIPLVVLDGNKPENLSRAILTGEFTGTLVSGSKKKILPL